MLIDLAGAKSRYGIISDQGIWARQGVWCTSYIIPDGINLINSLGSRQKHIYCNLDIVRPLDNALKNALNRGISAELKTFDGCLMIRSIRGEPGALSTHSYALAIDINASENKLGEEPTISPELVKCFTDEGFMWGGTFSRKDGMHFQFASW